MLFRVKNLGPIREAELDLSKDLIVLTGPNNTGKTYLTWAVYGLISPPLQLGRIDGLPRWIDDVSQAFAANRAVTELPLLPLDVLWESIAAELKRRLPEEFSSPPNRFLDTQVQVECSTEDLEKMARNSRRFLVGEQEFQIQVEGGQIKMVRTGTTVEHPKKGGLTIRPLLWVMTRIALLHGVLEVGSVAFPVERLAINLFARELAANRTQLVDQLLESSGESNGAQQDLLRRHASRYPRALRDALQLALRLSTDARSSFADLADELERSVLGGTLSKTESDELQFTPNASADGKPLGLHQSASVIKSLASIVWHLRYEAVPGQRLIIDEPELNLHPDNQRRIARVLAKAVNRGLKIMMSTHSDYLVRELNNLIMLSQDSDAARGLVQEMGIDPLSTIKPDRLGVYLVNDGECRAVPVTDTGFEVKTIDEEIHRLNRDSQTIYSRLFCE